MQRSQPVFRNLSPEELELVAGGNQTIVVEGERYDPWDDSWWYSMMFDGSYADGDGSGGGGGGAGGETETQADSAEHEVDLNINRTLTAAEQKAVNDLKAEITKVGNAINSIPDNATITLFDGSKVTGAELKAIWAATDFVINEKGHIYPNDSDRGEANYNYGDPVVSYNIDLLSTYDLRAGGMDYLIMHEIGHLTANSRAYNAIVQSDGVVTTDENNNNERLANDISRAIATYGHLPVMSNPGSGYSTTVPTFQTNTSGGGGTTEEYVYDRPFYYANYYWNHYNIQ